MRLGWLDDRTPGGQARRLGSHTPLGGLADWCAVVKASVTCLYEMSRAPPLGRGPSSASRGVKQVSQLA